MRLQRILPLTIVATAALSASAIAASQPTPITGSTTATGAYGVSVLKPPSQISCTALTKSQSGNGKYNIVLGARYGYSSSKASSVEAVLISGPGSTTPTYLKRPSSGKGWRYGNLPIAKCGGQKYTVRYKITAKGNANADKRVSVSFTVNG